MYAVLEIAAGELFTKYQPKILHINELTFYLKSTKESLRKQPGNFLGSTDLRITFNCVSKNFYSPNVTLSFVKVVPWSWLKSKHQVYSKLKQRGKDRSYVVLTCNTRGVFVGLIQLRHRFKCCFQHVWVCDGENLW